MYALWIAVGLSSCFFTLLWQLKGGKKPVFSSLLTVALASGLGVVMAKLFYVLLLADATLAAYGIEAFFHWDADTFSVFGAGAGALLGVWLSARIVKMRPAHLLDCFLPCGAFFLACIRAGEKELGTIGVGGYVAPQSLMARFPFSITNMYGEHLYAVFYLEAFFALLCGVLLLRHAKAWPAGVRTESGLFFLALTQVFCESLRARCMKWGFVRIEQLLCGVLLLALLWYACQKGGARPRRYAPALLGLLCIAGVVVLEFALDKSGIPIWLCYFLMGMDLLLLAVVEGFTVKKRFG